MREKRKTLDKKSENLNFKKIARKEKWQERGITLIALVVTIVILLILAGVTLNIALSDNGLFKKTKEAVDDYNQKAIEEKLQLIYTEKIMENNLNSKADVTSLLEEVTGGEITQNDIDEFNKILKSYNEEIKGIASADELIKIGNDVGYPIDGIYVQLNDINQITTQIGTEEKPFKGVYNGNGKNIGKLSLDNITSDCSGMFGVNEGNVRNITIENCIINSEKSMVGGIAGKNSGLIENCTISTGNIESEGHYIVEESRQDLGSCVGGICGYDYEGGIIRNCENSASVTGSWRLVGGICGFSVRGITENCSNHGSISGPHQVGGCLGGSYGVGGNGIRMIDCTNDATIIGVRNESEEFTTFGGIVGTSADTTISNCINSGDVRSDSTCNGGICGVADFETDINNSQNVGNIGGNTYIGRYSRRTFP